MSKTGHEVDAFNDMLRDGLGELRGSQVPDQSVAETFRDNLYTNHAALLGKVFRFHYRFARTFYNGQPLETNTLGVVEGTVMQSEGAGLQTTGRLNSYSIFEMDDYLNRRQTVVKIPEPSIFIHISDEHGMPEARGLELAVPIIRLGHLALDSSTTYE